MTKGPDYSKATADLYRQNLEEFWDDPLSRRDNAVSMSQRTGLSEEILIHWMCTDQMAALTFAKNPGKQSIHQNTAANWIKNLPFVNNFKVLEASGPKSKYLVRGMIIPFNKLGNSDDAPKSIDFEWEIRLSNGSVLTLYASHKYTGVEGGSQDNQYKDLLEFAQNSAQLKIEKGERILALADGPYYTKVRKATGKCGLDLLKEATNNSPFSDAMPCSDLPRYLLDEINSLVLKHNIQMTADEKDQLEVLKLIAS